MSSPSSSPAADASASRPPERNTRQRAAVSRALDELDDFVSTQELHRILTERGERVSLATAYRVLQSMADDGRVDVLRAADGEAVYRRCEVSVHHHHLVCRVCGKVVEVQAPAIESWAERIAAENGFTAVEHTVEVFGLCPRCSAERR
ncbi:Fur family transcriptional regulator [Tersicoccus sp. Bi-70]|uniref:Fur family transcriptional regulator n=1 Tax=Tersicoccus sp. Bi-70 TaxID=1897634 RepID=UPI0009755FA7|nr:Fur family transcriptional regulator [Tersicoccus sp. Bi-70]OMH36617.1 transcriptional repressor [Tersicoccus sp. Bi-70]